MTEHAVENTEFTLARKSTHVLVAGQEHACVFLRSQGVVHYEFIAQGKTVNQQCYLEMLIRLRNLFGGKDPESALIIGFSTMIMPHAHDALRVREFLAKNCITEMDHPPYSPDLVPCNFWLFPKLKKMP